MPYELKIRRAGSGNVDTLEVEALPAAVDMAKRWIKEGGCQRVDIYDPAHSKDIPIVKDEELREE
jgi:hypothetical protein